MCKQQGTNSLGRNRCDLRRESRGARLASGGPREAAGSSQEGRRLRGAGTLRECVGDRAGLPRRRRRGSCSRPASSRIRLSPVHSAGVGIYL